MFQLNHLCFILPKQKTFIPYRTKVPSCYHLSLQKHHCFCLIEYVCFRLYSIAVTGEHVVALRLSLDHATPRPFSTVHSLFSFTIRELSLKDVPAYSSFHRRFMVQSYTTRKRLSIFFIFFRKFHFLFLHFACISTLIHSASGRSSLDLLHLHIHDT